MRRGKARDTVHGIVNLLQEISGGELEQKRTLPPYNRVKLNSMSLRVRHRFHGITPVLLPQPRPKLTFRSVRYTTPSRTRRRRSDRSPVEGRRRHGYKWSSSNQPSAVAPSESSIKWSRVCIGKEGQRYSYVFLDCVTFFQNGTSAHHWFQMTFTTANHCILDHLVTSNIHTLLYSNTSWILHSISLKL